MADINLKLDEEGLKKLAAEAILAQLSTEERTSILQQAVSFLLTPKDQGYGYRKTTPLQDAFQIALQKIAHEVAREVLDEMPEVRAKMKEVAAEAYMKALVERREETVNKLSSAIVEAMICHDR
jgi:hypothetical protein